jgi:UDPglucose--hexose-1-phosphate uridylyltransferase
MNELRQDIASGDWVLLAPGRADRPKFLDVKKKLRKPLPKKSCPFEALEKKGNEPSLFTYPNEKNWQIAVIPNKYPALTNGPVCSIPFRQGIYHARTAVGSHNLLLTRDHNKHFIDLNKREITKVMEVFQAFHIMAAKDKCAAYISTFYNYGSSAGASIWHPHYQMLTLPIIPSHVTHSLRGAMDYFKEYGRCVRCDIITIEQKRGIRVIAQNEHAIAIAPYASKHPFEATILPKKHWASFRTTPPDARQAIALLLQNVMIRMKKYLNDPDLNFFIHDTPFGRKDYRHHHWHIEVIPRISIDAGFEFSTSIAINTTDPDNAAAILRGKKI